MGSNQNDWRNRRQALIWRLKAERGCMRCGEKNPIVLDFHHREPYGPRFYHHNRWVTTSIEALMEEIARCDILCANCHRIIEHEKKLALQQSAVEAEEVLNDV